MFHGNSSAYEHGTQSQLHALLGNFAHRLSVKLRNRNTLSFSQFHGQAFAAGVKSRNRFCGEDPRPRIRVRLYGIEIAHIGQILIACMPAARSKSFGRNRNIVRHVHVGQHLLRDALECGRGDLAAFMPASR